MVRIAHHTAASRFSDLVLQSQRWSFLSYLRAAHLVGRIGGKPLGRDWVESDLACGEQIGSFSDVSLKTPRHIKWLGEIRVRKNIDRKRAGKPNHVLAPRNILKIARQLLQGFERNTDSVFRLEDGGVSQELLHGIDGIDGCQRQGCWRSSGPAGILEHEVDQSLVCVGLRVRW